MRTLIVAVNAKYSHTNLAVRYLKHALSLARIEAEIAEYTINEQPRDILADLVKHTPDRVLFSCYLWNREIIMRIGEELRILFPTLSIILGGPEVSFDAQEQLKELPWASALICGEGENIIADVLQKENPSGVYCSTDFVDMDTLQFPYDELEALSHRTLYYESTRGCPYGCSYCLSSADRTVRRRSLALVLSDLQRFLDAQVMQVKFVDRTFNLDSNRALEIWRYLIENDNGFTSFQMELGGDLLTDEQILLLSTASPRLFQFEIGVQSTHSRTLSEVCRATDLEKLRHNVASIRAGQNIHQHLDLIAGLPGENFERFAKSYDDVLAMHPDQLQLGFLKLLRGSALYLRRAEYGLLYGSRPPYEILSTPEIDFLQLSRLKTVERMTEVYYNSGRFSYQLEYILAQEKSPFAFFLALGESMPNRAVGKYEYYDLLFDFALLHGYDGTRLSWLMRFDICLHERPRKLPIHCAPASSRLREITIFDMPKRVYYEVFPFDVTDITCPAICTALAFDPEKRDLAGRTTITRLSFSEIVV